MATSYACISFNACCIGLFRKFEIISLVKDAVFVADQNGLNREVDTVSFTHVEPWVVHVGRKIENYFFFEAFDRSDLLFELRLRRKLGLSLFVSIVFVASVVDDVPGDRIQRKS